MGLEARQTDPTSCLHPGGELGRELDLAAEAGGRLGHHGVDEHAVERVWSQRQVSVKI